MAAEFRPRGLLGHLTARGVDFVVIGGIALSIHGSDRNTFDLDIFASQDPDNLDVLGAALIEIEARLRGIEEDVPFVADGRSLKGIEILTLDTALGPLDVLSSPDGCPPYPQLRRRAKRVDLGSTSVMIASVDDLLEMKRAANRKKDELDVETLEAIKRAERRLARER